MKIMRVLFESFGSEEVSLTLETGEVPRSAAIVFDHEPMYLGEVLITFGRGRKWSGSTAVDDACEWIGIIWNGGLRNWRWNVDVQRGQYIREGGREGQCMRSRRTWWSRTMTLINV